MTVPNTILYNPAPQFTDDNGNPLDSGQLQIFEAGTNNLKTVYADNTQTTPITNPVELGSGGFTSGGVWIPEGNYDLSIERYIGLNMGVKEYARVRFRENIAGAGVVGSGSGTGMDSIDSIDELRAILPDTASLMFVSGYYGLGTAGGGYFYWDTSSIENDDGGAVISPDGGPLNGRWHRLFFSTDITMEMWGARTGIAYTNASNVTNMITFAKNDLSLRCVLNNGLWYLNGNVDFDGEISVLIKEGSRFTGLTGTHVLTFSCDYLEVESRTVIANKVPSSLITLVITSRIQCLPQWWGATEGTGSSSNYSFNTCLSNSGDNDILIDSPFAIESIDFTGHKLVKRGDGYLSLGAGGATFASIEASGFFIGGSYLSNMTFLNSVIEANWFNFFSGVNILRWVAWIDSLTSNGQKLVNWETGTVEFSNSYNLNHENIYKLRFNIGPNCIFKATGDINVAMPRIVSKSHCFDNTSTGSFRFRSTVLASQFGAVVGLESTFAPAMRYALKCGASVDLDGEEYDCDSDLNGVALTFGDVEIKNGTITLPSDFSPSELFTLNGNITFSNLFIDGSALTTAKRIIHSVGTWKVVSILGGGIKANISSDLFYDVGVANNVLISGGTYYSGLLRPTTLTNATNITGNMFFDTLLQDTDFDNLSITNNTFTRSTDSHAIELTGTTKTTRNGVVIKDNIYKGQSRNYFVGITFPNASDDNYPLCIENNVGTDVSTTYNFVRSQEVTTDTAKWFQLGDNNPNTSLPYVNYTACINGGFFKMTEFTYGVEALGDVYNIKGINFITIDPIQAPVDVNGAYIYAQVLANVATPQKLYITIKRGFNGDVN